MIFFSIHCQLLTRRQTSLTVALIPVERFSLYTVSGTQSTKGAGHTGKSTPIYVIHEEVSEIWVNVSIVLNSKKQREGYGLIVKMSEKFQKFSISASKGLRL